MSAIFAHDQSPSLDLIEPALPKIFDMISLNSTETTVVIECVKILGYLAKSSPDGARLLRRINTKEHLLRLLEHKDEDVVVSAIRASRYLVHPNIDKEVSFTKAPRTKQTNSQVPTKQVIQISDTLSPIRRIEFMDSKPMSLEYPLMRARKPWHVKSGADHTRYHQYQRGHMKHFLDQSPASRGTTYTDAHDYKANTTTKEDRSSPHRHFGRNLQDSRTLSCDVTPNHSKIKREPAKYQYLYPSHLPKDSIDLFDTKRVAMSKTIIPDNKPSTIKNGLLTDKEKQLLSDYMCFVLEQLQVCHIDQQQHAAYSRYSFPIGFPGLECKHCAGADKSRRFYWSSVERWKNNNGEFARHLLKCTYCPRSVTDQMNFMKTYHFIQTKTLEKGNANLVFSRLFRRLHAKESSVLGIVPTVQAVAKASKLGMEYYEENATGTMRRKEFIVPTPDASKSVSAFGSKRPFVAI